MGFLIHSVDSGHVPAFHYLPAEGLLPKAGMALVLTEGKLAAAAGTAMPQYVCMAERSTACGEGETVPVVRAAGEMVFETTSSAGFASVKLGDKVVLSSDGMQVAPEKGGAAQVVEIGDTAAGGMVRVRFVQPDAVPAA